MAPRTIILSLGEITTIAEMAQKIIDRGGVHPGPQIERAIGYLSSWCLTTYPRVEISVTDGIDLVGVYFKPDGTVGYTIAAIWNGERYGFHS